MSLVVAARMTLFYAPPLSLLLSDFALAPGVLARSLGFCWTSCCGCWGSSSCCSSDMGGTILQWFAWTHVALSPTFTAVCVISNTWYGPRQRFTLQLFHVIKRSDLMQEHLRNLPLGSFNLHRNVGQQTRHFAVIQHLIFFYIHLLMEACVFPLLFPWMVVYQKEFQMGSNLFWLSFSLSCINTVGSAFLFLFLFFRQKFSANIVKPFVNHNSFICAIIPFFFLYMI